MKKMKKYILAGTFALALASCSDSFLEEKNGIFHNTGLFEY